MKAPAIVWFRRDLRLADNPALTAAIASDHPLILLCVFEKTADTFRNASQAWLNESLKSLSKNIASKGGHLLLFEGDPVSIIEELVRQHQVTKVFCNQHFDPDSLNQEKLLTTMLSNHGAALHLFNGYLLSHPDLIKTRSNEIYKVFTPFWRRLSPDINPFLRLDSPPATLSCYSSILETDRPIARELPLNYPQWACSLLQSWSPGETGAHKRLTDFIEHDLHGYSSSRDYPAADTTSRLSPHLLWGEIAPWRVWHEVTQAHLHFKTPLNDCECFCRELGWREFAHYLYYHFPNLGSHNFRSKFDHFPWQSNDQFLTAWKQGATGFPIIDAAMRQLWKSGWMHNRMRMLIASFLVKDLMIDWREGASWFEETLVDASPASNAFNWQWAAGSGADAAPYFRIFNPSLQSKKFDKDGNYIRQWVPELNNVPTNLLHDPIKLCKSQLGNQYPQPILDHNLARQNALNAFHQL